MSRRRDDNRDMTTSKIYLQMTTGKLHSRKDCSITRRTRYNHADVTDTISADDLLHAAKCEKCWTDRIAPAADAKLVAAGTIAETGRFSWNGQIYQVTGSELGRVRVRKLSAGTTYFFDPTTEVEEVA